MQIHSRLILPVLGFLFFSSIKINAQEIKWQNISLGVDIFHIIPTSNFGEHWNNSLGIGGTGEYKISKNLSLIGDLGLSYIKSNEEKYPNIIYLGILGGLKYSFSLNKNFTFNSKIGLQSNSFEFLDDDENDLDDNSNESEFGIFISTGVTSNIVFQIPIELYVNYQTIFTSPRPLKVIQTGIKVFIF